MVTITLTTTDNKVAECYYAPGCLGANEFPEPMLGGRNDMFVMCLQTILYSFPAVCWAYGAGFMFSSFASLVFWGQPIARLYEVLRAKLTVVQPVGLQVSLSHRHNNNDNSNSYKSNLNKNNCNSHNNNNEQ